MSFRLPPPSGAVLEALSSPSKDVGQHVEVLSIRKLTLASMFFLGLGHTGTEGHVARPSHSVSSHSRGRTGITRPNAPTINHSNSTGCVAELQAPGDPRHSHQAGQF